MLLLPGSDQSLDFLLLFLYVYPDTTPPPPIRFGLFPDRNTILVLLCLVELLEQ